MGKVDRDLLERVTASIGSGAGGWTDVATICRRVYGDRPPTGAQTTAVNAALTRLRSAGAVERVGDSWRQTGTQP
jgi:hypothetical protein